jgi:hypothetical protein
MWRELIRDLDPQSTFFPGATTLQLTALEGALSITLREELKSLLMESNGVRGEYELRLIWSAEEIVQRNLDMRNAVFRESYMPFENLLFFADAGNGDQFAYPIIQGPSIKPDIFAWDHENDSRTWVAPSLRRYIEWWLSGKLKI